MLNQLYLVNPTDSWDEVVLMVCEHYQEVDDLSLFEWTAREGDVYGFGFVHHLAEDMKTYVKLVRHPWAPKGKLTDPCELRNLEG